MSPDLSPEPEPRTLGEHAADILPDLDTLAEQLRTDPEAVLGGEIPPELEREREELLGFARRAVEALRQCRGMEIRLMPEEEVGVQALLAFTSRPLIPVREDRFATPPPAWADLDRHRAEIETVLCSVGRVEMSGHPALSWAGTAWVAAPGLVLTSRHVVQCFAAPAGTAGMETRWRIEKGRAVRVDFGRELDRAPDERRIFEVPDGAEILVHPVHGLALMPVARTSRDGARELPAALPIAADGGRQMLGGEVREGRRVYVAGHPARDGRSPERLLRYRLFEGIFGVKRLQPGQVLQVLPGTGSFLHDASTLGGNSGAPVVDLETGRVVGLHQAGFHDYANLAVALWRLVDDPLLRF